MGCTRDSKPEIFRLVVKEQIEKSIAWAYFNGAYQGDPPLFVVGSVIHINDHHVIT